MLRQTLSHRNIAVLLEKRNVVAHRSVGEVAFFIIASCFVIVGYIVSNNSLKVSLFAVNFLFVLSTIL